MNNKNIFKLAENNQSENLEKHLRPQWSWKTFIFIISSIILVVLISSLLFRPSKPKVIYESSDYTV